MLYSMSVLLCKMPKNPDGSNVIAMDHIIIQIPWPPLGFWHSLWRDLRAIGLKPYCQSQVFHTVSGSP
jgi:hypothetical protein